ncbi:hypothetical protein [Tichowtungia aerotolerans]|uniref:Uncharacterized protein n=1 Tax=Tichowtungia aerotolerans TaxID=2697043 RepID=A0A6P1M3G0_9BACT|nr:hypothetical protein [Tichowtungia aerotolerans]QHI68387.1 hypothetical protein GT409_02580 [Tichowtungia aerotolerans]
MKRIKTAGTAMIVLLCLGYSSGWAAGFSFTDTFDGATSYSTNAAESIGAGWVNPYETTSAFRVAIKDNELNFDAPSGIDMNYIIYNTGMELAAGTSAGDGTNWTLSADVRTKINGTYAGVAFNIQDENNFYALRIKTGTTQAQVVKVVNGSVSNVEAGSTSMVSNTEAGQLYTFTITCDEAGTIDYTITEKGSSIVLNQVTSSTASVVFDGGYGGLYLWHGEAAGNSPEAGFDNFSIQTVVPVDYSQGTELYDPFDGSWYYSTNAVEAIGVGWVNPYETINAFRIARKGDELNFDAPADIDMNYMIYNTGLAMNAGTAGDGTNWMFTADVRTKNIGTYAGVAFNIQDENNFYALRIKTGTTQAQVVKVVNGSISNVEAGNASMISNSVAGKMYTFTVSCDSAGTIDYTITEKGSSTVLNQIVSSASSVVFDGGYGGLYLWHGESSGSSPEAVFDNFKLQVLPAVLELNTYSTWIDQYPMLGESSGYADDPDQDSMNNLLEYALGGNPTGSDAASVLPVFSIGEDGGSNWLYYTYIRRLDAADRQLSYTVVSGTELVTAAMTNVIKELSSSPIDDEFESVTTRISTAEETQSFLKLEVELSE